MSAHMLSRAGSSGAFGALMDEYARAAEDFLRIVETFDDAAFAEERPSQDPSCTSPRAICEHVVWAAYGYADDVRRSLGLVTPTREDRRATRKPIATAAEVRPRLRDAILWTEASGEPLRASDDDPAWAREFTVSWGSTYNAESILEHGIVHVLRHRRQLERWTGSDPDAAAGGR